MMDGLPPKLPDEWAEMEHFEVNGVPYTIFCLVPGQRWSLVRDPLDTMGTFYPTSTGWIFEWDMRFGVDEEPPPSEGVRGPDWRDLLRLVT